MDSLHHVIHQAGRYDTIVGNPLYTTQRIDVRCPKALIYPFSDTSFVLSRELSVSPNVVPTHWDLCCGDRKKVEERYLRLKPWALVPVKLVSEDIVQNSCSKGPYRSIMGCSDAVGP